MNHQMYPADQQTQTARPAVKVAAEPEMLHTECSLPTSPNSNQRASGKSAKANVAYFLCLGSRGFCANPEHIWNTICHKGDRGAVENQSPMGRQSLFA